MRDGPLAALDIDPSVLRSHVLRYLAHLSPDEHLAALHAIDHGDVELDLTGPRTVPVVLAGRWAMEVPVEVDP